MLYMKTKALRATAAVGLPILLATVAYRAPADDASAQATVAKPDKTYTGRVISVDPKENMLDVKGFPFSKKEFNLGGNCSYAIVDKESGTVGDLRPGQEVTVSYQDVHGVPIADRVTQKPMRDEGMVKAIDPATHKMTLSMGIMNKTFQLPDNCDVTLHGGNSGAIADIQPGNHVTVTYEVPNGRPTAREIAQTSVTFTGELTAIDLSQKTVKAEAAFTTKKFNVGDDCAILVNGKPVGKLTDLRPGENLTFSYNDINGVNIVNRIAPAKESPPNSVAENR
jgi:hypothetical protein